MNEKEQIKTLQKQVDQIQIKLLREKQTKWYKQPSILISVVALLSSLVFSIDSIIEKRNKSEEKKLSSLKMNLTELVDEEKTYYDMISSPYIDDATKVNYWNTYKNKSLILFEKINNQDPKFKKIEPTLILSYGNILSTHNRYNEAKYILEKGLELTKDRKSKSNYLIVLSNFYSNSSTTYFDTTKARDYRLKSIENQKSTWKGDDLYSSLSSTFEQWALIEFQINNEYANNLLDSAKKYNSKLINSGLKEHNNNRIVSIFNFNNGYLTEANISGQYTYESSDGKKGTATISKNSLGWFSLHLEYFLKGSLRFALSGNQGEFTNASTLKFNASTEEVKRSSGSNMIIDDMTEVNYESIFNQGIFELKSAENNSLEGTLSIFKSQRVNYSFKKITTHNNVYKK